ncbi:hypothetical protein [Pseudodonghicola xiamenensis]|uniref:Uncharacterized protein n=1 Tax=Pseudodonghicola xiamenensis TaxID=337702 RepID=A0A8J3H4M7_9RHOB|nr:hypothetical protein [Pseudodonghicola xiamenensis]GHG86177.1 hypothetical protein GCM10010961_13930 [Pseudodonghicola xiamenensis]
MKKTIALLAASTALTAVIALPALSDTRRPDEEKGVFAALFGEDGDGMRHWFVSDDDDDDDGEKEHGHSRKDRDDDDDDDDGARGGMNPAPAGTSAPPKNGLFGSGAAPQVQVN